MKLTLDLPPSMNTYWRSIGRGRVLISEKGREYRQHVENEVGILQRRMLGRLAVSIVMFPPDRRRRDLDNIAKALLDSLQHAAVYQDDSQIDDLRIVRGERMAGGGVSVEIREIEREAH